MHAKLLYKIFHKKKTKMINMIGMKIMVQKKCENASTKFFFLDEKLNEKIAYT